MKDKKTDILEKIFFLSIFDIFQPFLKKYKEILLYLFFGGVTVFLNIFLFFVINQITELDELVNNVICWIVCVIFQFFTNRTWVFNKGVNTLDEFLKQMVSFISGRIITLFIEELILAMFIYRFGFNLIIIKIIAQIIVIILNYIISKTVVFKK